MAHAGKRLRKAREGIERTKLYPLSDAVKLVKERANAKFDETVEIAMNLGVDPKHADQMVRGVVNLPNGSGRSVCVAVFARGAKAELQISSNCAQQAYTASVAGSTLTPGPIVEQIATR